MGGGDDEAICLRVICRKSLKRVQEWCIPTSVSTYTVHISNWTYGFTIQQQASFSDAHVRTCVAFAF